MLAWLGAQTVTAAWQVTERNVNDPASIDVGYFARENLADNAVLVCEGAQNDEHLMLMFHAGRTCYPLAQRNLELIACEIRNAGGVPYLVSHRPRSLVRVYVSPIDGTAIYQGF